MELVSIWPLIEDQLRKLCAGLLNVSIDRGDLSELLREVTRCRPTGNAKDLAHQLHQARNEFAHRKGTDLPETVWLSMFSAAARFADEFPNHPSSEQIRSLYAQAKPILSQLLTIPTQKTIHSDDLVRWTKNHGFLNRYDKRIARKWIIDQVVSAIEREDSHLVVIHGAPGVGKSTIAAEWIETHQTTCAYHINEYDNEDSKSTDALVSALVGSLLETNPEFQPGVTYRDIVGGSDSSVPAWHSLSISARWNRFIVEPLAKWDLANNGRFTLFVDALDESLQQQVEFLSKHHADLPATAKLIVTARPEIKVHKAAVVIGIDDPRQNNDIRSYVALNIPNANLSNYEWNSLVDDITSQANGVFVAAKLLIDAYNGEGYAPSAPHAMNNLFADWFGRAMPIEHRPLTSQLLRILCLAFSSMPTTVLRSALNISERELREHLSRLGSLVDVQDNRVRLFHKLLADWILDPDTLIINGSMESTQLRLAEVMLDDASDYAARYAIRHLLSAGHGDLAVEKLTDFRYMQWRVTKGYARDCYSDLCAVDTNLRTPVISDWLETFRQNCEHWMSLPELFHQDCRNCPDFSDPCVKAYKEPITGPWVMELNKPQCFTNELTIALDENATDAAIVDSENKVVFRHADSISIYALDTGQKLSLFEFENLEFDSSNIVHFGAMDYGSGIWLVTHDGEFYVYCVRENKMTLQFDLSFAIEHVDFSPDDKYCLVQTADHHFRLLETDKLVEHHRFLCLRTSKPQIQWDPQSRYVAVVEKVEDGTLSVGVAYPNGSYTSKVFNGIVNFSHSESQLTVDYKDFSVVHDLLDGMSIVKTIDEKWGIDIEMPNYATTYHKGLLNTVGRLSDQLLSRYIRSNATSESTVFAISNNKYVFVYGLVANVNHTTYLIDEKYKMVSKCSSYFGYSGLHLQRYQHRVRISTTDIFQSAEHFWILNFNQVLVDYKLDNQETCLVLGQRYDSQFKEVNRVLVPVSSSASRVIYVSRNVYQVSFRSLEERGKCDDYLVNFSTGEIKKCVDYVLLGSTARGVYGLCQDGLLLWSLDSDVFTETGVLVSRHVPIGIIFDGTCLTHDPRVTGDYFELFRDHVAEEKYCCEKVLRQTTFTAFTDCLELKSCSKLDQHWLLMYPDSDHIELDPLRPNRITYTRSDESRICELMYGEEPAHRWWE